MLEKTLHHWNERSKKEYQKEMEINKFVKDETSKDLELYLRYLPYNGKEQLSQEDISYWLKDSFIQELTGNYRFINGLWTGKASANGMDETNSSGLGLVNAIHRHENQKKLYEKGEDSWIAILATEKCRTLVKEYFAIKNLYYYEEVSLYGKKEEKVLTP